MVEIQVLERLDARLHGLYGPSIFGVAGMTGGYL